MPIRKTTNADLFTRVRALARSLPGMEEGTSYGTPALRVGKKFVARLHDNGAWLVLKLDFPSRDDLLQRNPKLFFTTDHYRGYPTVLIDLAKITDKQLAALLEDAWRLAAPRSRQAERQEKTGRDTTRPRG